MNHVWDTLVADWPMIVEKMGEHMYLSLISVLMAGIIAIPLVFI